MTKDATCEEMNEEGTTLMHNSKQILKCLEELRKQRDEINLLILKQKDEREMLVLEMERIKYKINLIAKSLAQRLATKEKYDQIIREAETYYHSLVERSSVLLGVVKKEVRVLEECIDKKCGDTRTVNNQTHPISPMRKSDNGDVSELSKLRTSSVLHNEQMKLQKASISQYRQINQPIMIYGTVDDVKESEYVKSSTSRESIGTVGTIKSTNQKLHSSNTAIYPGTIYPEASPSASYETHDTV